MGRNKYLADEIKQIAKLLRLKNASNRAGQKQVRHDLRTQFEFNISDFNKPGKAFGEEEQLDDSFSVKTMLPLAVATSIDALAVGVSFACIDVDIVPAIAIIGTTTFILSAVGIKIGNVFGAKYKSKAEFLGGAVLILLGLKILLEDLGFLPF